MNPSDYRTAYDLISSWNDEATRASQMEALEKSDRRANVVVAMVLIAALLSKITSVSEGFVEQLTRVNDANLEAGILNITDQILQAVDADDDPENAGADKVLDKIPEAFAFRDIIGHEDI